jgi:hypothetical protein
MGVTIADRVMLKCSERSLIKCHFLYHKCNIDFNVTYFTLISKFVRCTERGEDEHAVLFYACSVKFDVLSFIVIIIRFSLLVGEIEGVIFVT